MLGNDMKESVWQGWERKKSIWQSWDKKVLGKDMKESIWLDWDKNNDNQKVIISMGRDRMENDR